MPSTSQCVQKSNFWTIARGGVNKLQVTFRYVKLIEKSILILEYMLNFKNVNYVPEVASLFLPHVVNNEIVGSATKLYLSLESVPRCLLELLGWWEMCRFEAVVWEHQAHHQQLPPRSLPSWGVRQNRRVSGSMPGWINYIVSSPDCVWSDGCIQPQMYFAHSRSYQPLTFLNFS